MNVQILDASDSVHSFYFTHLDILTHKNDRKNLSKIFWKKYFGKMFFQKKLTKNVDKKF